MRPKAKTPLTVKLELTEASVTKLEEVHRAEVGVLAGNFGAFPSVSARSYDIGTIYASYTLWCCYSQCRALYNKVEVSNIRKFAILGLDDATKVEWCMKPGGSKIKAEN